MSPASESSSGPPEPPRAAPRPELWGSRADEPLALVDADGARIGTSTRAACHALGGQRHAAFSVYLFTDDGELLVQRRDASKPLWPGFWSNSCCSHPVGDEVIADAAVRRVREELGVDAELEQVHRYEYSATYGDVGTEHEVVTVFIGRVELDALDVDPTEVSETRTFAVSDLDASIGDDAAFTPWFQLAWPAVKTAWAARSGS